MKGKKGKLFARLSAAAMACLSTAAFAAMPVMPQAAATTGWPDDASANLGIATGTDSQAQPKAVPTPDGGLWISWLDSNSTAGYDVRIQRLNALGQPQLGPDGVLVAKRYFSATQDYGLAADSAGDALLAFRISAPDGSDVRVEAQKVAPDGTLVWGPVNATTGIAEGIRLGNSADYIATPDVAVTSDDDVVVGWNDNLTALDFAKLDSDGNELWSPEASVANPGGGVVFMGRMHGSDNGSVIVSYAGAQGFRNPRSLLATKLDADGTAGWTTTVYDGGNIGAGGIPDFVPDGSGGAVFTWAGFPKATPTMKYSYVQHLAADGSEDFAHNGVTVTGDVVNQEIAPSVAYDPGSQDIFVAWEKSYGGPQQYAGAYGQMIDPQGHLAWGSDGVQIQSKAMFNDVYTATVAIGDSVLVFYSSGPSNGNEQIYAVRIGADGKYLWGSATSPLDVSSTPVELKFDLQPLMTSAGMPVLAWQDGDLTNTQNILAQNVNVNGTLGNHTPVASDGTLEVKHNKMTDGTLVAASPDGAALTYAIAAQPADGTVTLNDPSTGEYTYTPNAGYVGGDSFNFTANNDGIASNVATVDVTVDKKPPSSGGGALGFAGLGLLAFVGLMGLVRRRQA